MKSIWYMLVVSLIIFTVTQLPIFKIIEINIVGNVELTKKEIIDKISIIKNKTNIFYYSVVKDEKRLILNPYIENLEINKKFPNKIEIVVKERVGMATISYANEKFIHIDKEGYVLSVASTKKNNPNIIGFDISSFIVGEKIISNNSSEIAIFNEIISKMKKYGLATENITIDIENNNFIMIKSNDILIHFGDMQEADDKVRTLKGIIDALEARDSMIGVIDISNTKVQPYLAF